MFKLATKKRPEMASFLEDGRKLADALQTLADREADAGTGSLDAIMPSLARLLGKKGFSKIMIPTTKNMSIMLPSADDFEDVGSSMYRPGLKSGP